MLKYILVSAFVVFGSAQAFACDYAVRPHETLSQIAYRNYPQSRLYGKRGSLRKLLKFNIDIQNPNVIEVSQKVHLPQGEYDCKIASVSKKMHKKTKRQIAKVDDDDAPIVHKVKLYHHRLAVFSLDGRPQMRSPASLKTYYKVPEVVVRSTPEIIFERGFFLRQIKFRLPLD